DFCAIHVQPKRSLGLSKPAQLRDDRFGFGPRSSSNVRPPLTDVETELSTLLQNKKVIVCCGAGGVGKTTTSAALALAAAQKGRRVVVLTIDPARRLAQAMGIAENARSPTPIAVERLTDAGVTRGSLDAWMLNPDVVFEGLVQRLATSPEQARRILNSR